MFFVPGIFHPTAYVTEIPVLDLPFPHQYAALQFEELEAEALDLRLELRRSYNELTRLIDRESFMGTAADVLAVAAIGDGEFVVDVHAAMKTIFADAAARRDMEKYKGAVKCKIVLEPDETDNAFIVTTETKTEVPASAVVGKLYTDDKGVSTPKAFVDKLGLLNWAKDEEPQDEAA